MPQKLGSITVAIARYLCQKQTSKPRNPSYWCLSGGSQACDHHVVGVADVHITSRKSHYSGENCGGDVEARLLEVGQQTSDPGESILAGLSREFQLQARASYAAEASYMGIASRGHQDVPDTG